MSILVIAGSAIPRSSQGVVLADVFTTVNSTSLNAKDALITVAGVIAVFFVIAAAVRSGMAITRIVISLVTAGLLLWGVSNTSWWQKQTGDTLNQPGAMGSVSAPSSVLSASALV